MRSWLRFIAALEVVGGVIGIGLLVWLLSAIPLDALSAAVVLLMMAVNALSVVAGIALWRGSRAGRTLSIVVQLIQLPKVVSPQLVFIFSFGLDLWVYFAQVAHGLTLGFQFNVLATSRLHFGAQGVPFTLAGVSLSSIAFLAMLIAYKGDGREGGGEPQTPPPPPPPPPDWQQTT